ncbi:MAG: class I SAM-dependent rRNA methyltransferase, partial [Bdellovibrionales bacterium]|nr:class I SAM-dependent rRNA methyltransferase [Oligoflexia bacterium]
MLETILKSAFEWRNQLGLLNESEALRIFYGPGESNHPELQHLSADLYKDHLWLTAWKKISSKVLDEACEIMTRILPFKIEAIVLMDRSVVASEAEVVTLRGTSRSGRFAVKEFGVKYLVQMEKTKHPGLFLDHSPLRFWLQQTQKNKTVLNLFSYTGSLSVAAAHGGARKVTTLDLSKHTIEWAKENWANSGFSPEAGDFIYGDTFEWLPKFKKRGEQFDTILCDPPSFSRSKNGVF